VNLKEDPIAALQGYTNAAEVWDSVGTGAFSVALCQTSAGVPTSDFRAAVQVNSRTPAPIK
jgi:hypothetical protein